MTDSPHPTTPSQAPTARQRRRQSSLVHQAIRFVVLNLKILKLSRQHH